MEVPFLNIEQPDEIHLAFQRVVSSNSFILGSQVNQFESEFASYVGTDSCVGTGNGYDALFIALKSLGIEAGDEVIVSSNAYIACWLAISNLGAVPVPVEPSEDTMNINPDLIEAHITSNTKAIMAVHLYGLSCDMEKIMQLATKYCLWVVEDYAQAHGAKYNEQLCGSFGHLNATSFYPTKNLGALGDAGAITGNDQGLLRKSRLMGNYGSIQKYENEIIGLNSRLDELQAAFLRVKLQKLKENNLTRRALAKRYLDGLSGVGKLVLPFSPENCFNVYHLFVIRTVKRDLLKTFLEEKGIQTHIHYPIPPHLQTAYKFMGFSTGDFPIAEEIASKCLSLPLYPSLDQEQQDYVIETIKRFFDDAEYSRM